MWASGTSSLAWDESLLFRFSGPVVAWSYLSSFSSRPNFLVTPSITECDGIRTVLVGDVFFLILKYFLFGNIDPSSASIVSHQQVFSHYQCILSSSFRLERAFTGATVGSWDLTSNCDSNNWGKLACESVRNSCFATSLLRFMICSTCCSLLAEHFWKATFYEVDFWWFWYIAPRSVAWRIEVCLDFAPVGAACRCHTRWRRRFPHGFGSILPNSWLLL